MTRHNDIVARRQDARLARLAVARHDQPGRPASLEPSDLPILAVMAAADHLLELTRMLRMTVLPDEDPAARRLVVVCGAVASSIASDVRTGGSAETERLYLAITAYQQGRNS